MAELNENRKRRRGPEPLSDPRVHSVNVRLNDVELALLNNKRGSMARAEWLRCAAVDQLPPTIPLLNQRAYAELARAAGNLNQVSRVLNQGDKKEAAEILSELAAFRLALIGAKL